MSTNDRMSHGQVMGTAKPLLYQHVAERGYPKGATATCPRCGATRNVFTSELIEWFSTGFPRCKKCDKRIEIEPIK